MTEFAGKRATVVAIVVLAALSALGIGCWVAQVASGAHLLNLTNYDMWGIYLAAFTVATGIAAGSLAFAGAACLVPACASWFPYARIAAFAGGVGGTVMAGLFIMADLGAPWRSWEIIAMLHPGSPLFWDTVVLSAFLVVSIALVVKLGRVKTPSSKGIKALAVIALIAGACVVITSFVFVAIFAAAAFLTLVIAACARCGLVENDAAALRRLGVAGALAAAGELVFALSEIAMGAFAGAGEHAAVAMWLIGGPGAPFFWTEIVALVAAVALWLVGKNTPGRLLASAAALVASLLVKYNLLQAQLFNPLIDYAGFGQYSGLIEGAYFPSLIEWGVCIGIVAIAGLLCTVGFAKLGLARTDSK